MSDVPKSSSLAAGLLVSLAAACSTPPPLQGAPVIGRATPAVAPRTPVQPSVRASMRPHDGRVEQAVQRHVTDTGPAEETLVRTLEDFRDRYRAAGQPRIAVLFNRELSDDIHEWRSPVGKDGLPALPKRQEERLAPPEDWEWQFEEGFLTPLLRERVRMIDRATILRLVAAAEGEQSPNAPPGPKRVEMEALQGYADLYLELLVKRDTTALHGYRFHAKVLQVRTGEIKMSTTSFGRTPASRTTTTRGVVATERGLEFQSNSTTTWPTLREVGEGLALETLARLGETL